MVRSYLLNISCRIVDTYSENNRKIQYLDIYHQKLFSNNRTYYYELNS